MGDIVRCSLEHEDLLYQLFGVNAELLIDHAWGYECVNISDIKSHQPETKSISSGQVLSRPYAFLQAKTIIKEMAENLALELVEKSFVTNHLVLYIEYDRENKSQNSIIDRYDRRVPKPAQGTKRLTKHTSATSIITKSLLEVFDNIVNPAFTIRKITISANDLVTAMEQSTSSIAIQPDLFMNYTEIENKSQRETRTQKAIIEIRKRYGKNAILRGINFEPESTGRNRHHQIGGHRA